MLSIQSVNLAKQPAFKCIHDEVTDYEEIGHGVYQEVQPDMYYSKDAYESDKSKLEQQLDDINEVIQNTSVPKPIRVIGKIATIGIGSALGFVSMRYGAQGMAKIARKGMNYAKSFTQKPSMQKLSQKLGSAKENSAKHINNLMTKLKETQLSKDLMERTSKLTAKVKDSKFAEKMTEISNKVSDNKLANKITEKAQKAKNAIKSITSEQVENGVVNLFAVSGGVTGGVTALQEVTKE